jgi:disulfide oxidoreductase YuzD
MINVPLSKDVGELLQPLLRPYPQWEVCTMIKVPLSRDVGECLQPLLRPYPHWEFYCV